MAIPRTDYLARSYYDKQIDRLVKSIQRIAARNPVATGRIVPTAEDLPIHDGRRLEEASVMFLDISKFSGRPAWTEQEQQNLLRILSLFFTEMIRIVEDYGGDVEKNTGDGLMAYFVREPNDNTAPQEKALAAALTMFYIVEKAINPFLAQFTQPLDFRICLDHGPITVARVGTPRGFNGIVAVGTTANIAAKMLSDADPNTILMGTKFLIGLSQRRQNEFAALKKVDPRWFYRDDGKPYAYWQYTGRWTEPLS